MAVVNNGYKVNLSKSLIPSGFVNPAYSEVTPFEYCREEVLTVDRATISNANKLTTFQNILDDVTIGLDKQINDIIVADYIATNDVQYSWTLEKININVVPSLSNDFYTNAPEVYQCSVKINIKTN